MTPGRRQGHQNPPPEETDVEKRIREERRQRKKELDQKWRKLAALKAEYNDVHLSCLNLENRVNTDPAYAFAKGSDSVAMSKASTALQTYCYNSKFWTSFIIQDPQYMRREYGGDNFTEDIKNALDDARHVSDKVDTLRMAVQVVISSVNARTALQKKDQEDKDKRSAKDKKDNGKAAIGDTPKPKKRAKKGQHNVE
jgi:hypothetical protein